MAKFPIRPIQIHFFQKVRFWANERLSHHDFLHIFFELVALYGMTFGYTQGYVVLTGEGGYKFWITLYMADIIQFPDRAEYHLCQGQTNQVFLLT